MILKYYLMMFIGVMLLSGCTAGGDEESIHKPVKNAAAKSDQKYKYSVYLENSGSLNGYLKASGDDDFKSNVYDIIATLSNLREKRTLGLYLINTKTDTIVENVVPAQMEEYFKTINSDDFKKRSKKNGSDLAQSNLYDVIRKVLEKAGPGDVSLFISDCIFSPGKQRDALNYLHGQESSIKALFGGRLSQQPFATLVLQFYSDFDGTYYYQDNTAKTGVFKKRPYYIVCFGNEQALYKLLQYVARPDTKGFQDYLFLTSVKQYDVAPTIRDNSEYYAYDPETPLVVTRASKGGTDNRFRIMCNVDYSGLPVSAGYLQNLSNYTVEQGYTVESVKERHRNKATHEIVLVAARPQAGKVHITLKKQLPEWVSASNLSADKGLAADSLKGKTFGIRYLLNGMYSAYAGYTQTAEYFNFIISVKD